MASANLPNEGSLQAWLLPVSRRHQVEKLVKGSDVDIDMYDTATGQIIQLPRVFTYGGRSFTFFPPHRPLPRH